MEKQWTPDITDKSLITPEKMVFIYDSAALFLKDTLEVADKIKESAQKFLAIVIPVVTAVTGYMLVNCAGEHACSARITTAATVLVSGYIIAVLLVLWKCLWGCHYGFNGNEPCNLFCTDVMSHGLESIKAGSLVSLQRRIRKNVANNLAAAVGLNWGYLVAGLTPIIAGLFTVFIK